MEVTGGGRGGEVIKGCWVWVWYKREDMKRDRMTNILETGGGEMRERERERERCMRSRLYP